MIIGLLLRNIKIYHGINYVPLSSGDGFCGLVGDNGIGKSSVLEALDCYFNDREWNLNVVTKKSGFTTTKPYIVPIFLLPKAYFKESADNSELLEKLSSYFWSVADDDLNPANRRRLDHFYEQREQLIAGGFDKGNYLLAIGLDHNKKASVGVFNCNNLKSEILGPECVDADSEDDYLEKLKIVYDEIKQKTDYIYIPREIDPETFTKLESKEIQILMGETLAKIVEDRVTPEKISEINQKLSDFLELIARELSDYAYRTPTERQKHLRKNDIYNVIIETYFSVRKLHKKHGDNWLEIGSLSSGEKQKAIIQVAHGLLENHRSGASNLIMAIDEPESSLHMSACFDQFLKLYEISRTCRQVVFSSHWYGFFPTIETGFVSVITQIKQEHKFDLINLDSYRQSIKRQATISKGKLPFDIRLKSINDFVQSLITSIIASEPFNWIICEGSSEKIYFSKYFEDEIRDKRLRIVPVGGAREVKRIYGQLAAAYDDYKDNSKGTIFLLVDTDQQLVEFETSEMKNIICRRLVSDDTSAETKLVRVNQNPKSPKTEIEDALNGRIFSEVLKYFSEEYQCELDFIDINKIYDESSSYYSLDLRPTEHKKLMEFFDKDDNKIRFARKYVDLVNDNYAVPKWIDEIKKHFQSL